MCQYGEGQEQVSFDVLDRVVDLTPSWRSKLLRTGVFDLGPLLEVVHGASPAEMQSLSAGKAQPSSGPMLEMLTPVRTLASTSTDHCPAATEIVRLPISDRDFTELSWGAFCTRAQRAGERAGLGKRFAQALAGTLEEMAYNVFDHSRNRASGIAGYRWSRGHFEYAVSDSGVGVLSSLRSNPRYGNVLDHGEALEVAVRDGESRHLDGTGHGFGFHHLVTNIARRSSYLRFRSGDHALIIDGRGQDIRREVRQTGELQGFLVSVVAYTGSPKDGKQKGLTEDASSSILISGERDE